MNGEISCCGQLFVQSDNARLSQAVVFVCKRFFEFHRYGLAGSNMKTPGLTVIVRSKER